MTKPTPRRDPGEIKTAMKTSGSAPILSPIPLLGSFLSALVKSSGNKIYPALGLLIFQGLFSGLGLFTLIPLLHLAGLTQHGQPPGKLISFTLSLFVRLGIPINFASVLLIYVSIVALLGMIQYWQKLLNSCIHQEFCRYLRSRLYNSFIKANWLFITRQKISNLSHLLSAELNTVAMGASFLLTFFGSATISLVYIIFAMLLSPLLTILAICLAGLLSLVLKPFSEQSILYGARMRDNRQQLYETINLHLGGIKLTKSYGLEKEQAQNFSRANAGIAKEMVNFSRLSGRLRFLFTLGPAICISILFYVSVRLLNLPIENLLLLVYIFSRLLPQISNLHQYIQRIFNMLPSFAAYQKMQVAADTHQEEQLNDPIAATVDSDARHLAPLKAGSTPLVPLTREIQFVNLSFQYPGEREFSLQNLEFSLPANQITCIVGPSGAGKSTLADLLLGLLRPQKGHIEVDGLKLEQDNLANWRRSVSYMPQDPFLFHHTIRENLLWGNVDLTVEGNLQSIKDDLLWQALSMAAADDFVKSFPAGLNTKIGDMGFTLSGGQRQRLALARALLKKPSLLLLDEPCTSLDRENELIIQAVLKKLKKEMTMVFIAHHPSFIGIADLVINLENGVIVK